MMRTLHPGMQGLPPLQRGRMPMAQVLVKSRAPQNSTQPYTQARDDQPVVTFEQVLVLIAEDEDTIAETLALIVEDIGYLPVIAHDGREALALARQHRPRLLITDLMMPHLNGGDLIAALREDAASLGIDSPPVIVVTAAGRARAEETGADVIIPKPFDVAKVEDAINQLVGMPNA